MLSTFLTPNGRAAAIVVMTYACVAHAGSDTRVSAAFRPEPARRAAPSNYGELAASFVENRGQSNSSVRFLAEGGGVPIFFTDRDVRFLLAREGRRAAVVLELAGSRTSARVAGQHPTGGVVNYLRGREAGGGSARLPAYRDVVYHDAWPGVDALFRGESGALVYEFIVHPGGRVEDIRLRIHGVDRVALTERGELEMRTSAGTVVDRAPDTYQLVGGQRQPIASRFVLTSQNEVTFAVGPYDRTRPLVIDPSIVYATYLGGSGVDEGWAIAVDSSGAAYVTGVTASATFPVTAGAYDVTGANKDAFVAKIAPGGDRFDYITYLGGSNDDTGSGIAIDGGGSAYVTGFTKSADFPVTTGAFRGSIGAGGHDAFVTKLNPTGTGIVYSTFLGANAMTTARAIAVDALGQAHITGDTFATNLPSTAGAVTVPRVAAGLSDAFLTKLNASGRSILFGSYVGGSAGDVAYAIAVDTAGNAYLGGTTASQDLRTTSTAPQPSPSGGQDAFVVKINTLTTGSADALVYGSYIGGSSWDSLHGIAVDSASQSAYLGILTFSWSDFPTADGETVNAAVAMKMNAAGTRFDYSHPVGPTYRGYTTVEGLAIDAAGNAYLAGSSDDQANYTWVSRVDPNGIESARVAIDGTPPHFIDWLYGIAVDAAGGVYVAGYTSSDPFPVTNGAPQRRYGGATDAYIAKVTFADVGVSNLASGSTAVASSIEGTRYSASFSVDGSLSTRWSSRFSDPEWIYVDLGQRYHVDRVVLHWETAYARFYQLQISDDAVNWVPLATGSIEGDGGIDNLFNLTGAGRYVRIHGTARATQWGYSLWEIEVYGTKASTPSPPPASTNLALKRFTFSSEIEPSVDGRYGSHAAVDGRTDTRWSSAFSDPQWIAVDLGQLIDVSRVVLNWETAFGADYQIQVSNDARAWTTIRSVTGGNGGIDDLTGLSGTGRYVRMIGTRRGTQWGYSLWEFEIYGLVAQGSPDIVLYASDALDRDLHGWSKVADPSSPNGVAAFTPDNGYSSTDAPPALFDPSQKRLDLSFAVPQAGTYKVWLRLKAANNNKFNDSVWVQFSQATVNGAPTYELGSNSALLVNLENCSACGVSGWGWQDNAWWLNQPTVVALPGNLQTIRILAREDGVALDQIVLSPVRFLNTAPGTVKNDTTIVPK